MNENKKMSFVDFLIQLIFIILFVMLLVWLFPTKDWLKENYYDVDDDYIIEKDSTISDSKFVDNINNMLDASKDYFGYNVNLPENIDDTVTVTLDELVDSHVMLMPKDSKGKKCDGDSNAVITKLNNGYSIKVTLTCGDLTDYIIRNVGCNPFCENNCTQKCKLEYEYSKNVDGYYTNWSSWSAWSVNKKTASSTLKVEQKTVASKICPSGYTLNSDKTLCVKNIKNEEIVDADIVKSCPSGYSLNSDKTLCVKSVSSNVSVDATKVYSCPSGYNLTSDNKCSRVVTTTKEVNATKNYSCSSGSLSGSTCYKTISTSSSRSERKYCSGGYTYIGSNKCQKVSTYVKGTASSGGSNCSISYELDCSNGCKTIAKETCIKSASTSYSYSCPSGYELSWDQSTCTKTETRNADYSYSCNGGILNGDKCIITSSNTEIIESQYSYKCASGTLSGDKCIINNTNEDTTDVVITYSCKNGALNGNKCVIVNENSESTKYTLKNVVYYRYATRKYVKATVSYKWSSSREDKKLIDAGYKLTGKTRQNCSK